jgi:hypothetical protein
MAPVHWVFDFTSLMILIGEPHESKFRSCRDTLLEVLVAAPVAGIQSYLKSYEALPNSSAIRYLSPYGVKRAPLRNMRLHYFITYWELLRNGKYTTYNIPDGEPNEGAYKSLSAIWLIFTWLYFGGVVAFWRLAPFGVLPKGTWIGIANVATFTGWSIILRVIEFVMMKSMKLKRKIREIGLPSPRQKKMESSFSETKTQDSSLLVPGRRSNTGPLLTDSITAREEPWALGTSTIRDSH